MKLENWLEEQLLAGVVIVRGRLQRSSGTRAASSYTGLDVRAYAYRRDGSRPTGAVSMARVHTIVAEDRSTLRQPLLFLTHAVGAVPLRDTLAVLTADWCSQWREQEDVMCVMNRTEYPASNPYFTRHLSRIQGGLEVLSDQHRGDPTPRAQIARALDRIVTDAQKELGRHIAFPRG